jgi:glycosyltransferase involved in cell wall biosynthesis
MFVNPYGVSLKHFYPTTYTGDFDVIYVGTWSQRKGVLILMEAFKNTDIRVLHVGGIKDVGFPQLKNFVHIDPVPENTLLNYYRKAQIFVFPSYDDGFGLVLLQAAACGLPIVCSPNCGGSTLKRMIDDKDNIYVMNEFSPKELEKGVFKFLNQAVNKNPRNYVGDKLELFSWKAYGERYDEFLHEIELKKNQL